MRQRILEATVERIESAGERSVRLRDIARAVGIAEPSLYHYYPNREALIVESQAYRLRRSLAITVDPFVDAIRHCSSREEFIRILLSVYQHSYEAERAAVRAVRAEIVGNSFHRKDLQAVVAEAFTKALEQSVEALDLAQQRGWLPERIDTSAFAMFNLSLISSLVFPEVYADATLLTNWKMLAEQAITLIITSDS